MAPAADIFAGKFKAIAEAPCQVAGQDEQAQPQVSAVCEAARLYVPAMGLPWAFLQSSVTY
jgi:hypothetical protein